MLRRDIKKNKQAQSLTEYALLLGVVVLIFTSMNTLIQRGINGMIRTVSDQVGFQNESDQIKSNKTSHLVSRNETQTVATDKTYTETVGFKVVNYGDSVALEADALINFGFTEDF